MSGTSDYGKRDRPGGPSRPSGPTAADDDAATTDEGGKATRERRRRLQREREPRCELCGEEAALTRKRGMMICAACAEPQ